MFLAFFKNRANFPRARTGFSARTLLSAALLAVFAMSVLPTVSAHAETRTLKLYFTHTKESATITFKKNGRYVKSGLRKLNRFLRDWRRKEPTKMDPELMDLVWEVYKKSGSRKPIHVISAYRSPRTNNMLRRRGRKVARNSQHTRGKALDFFMPDVSVKKLRALGLKAHRGGVGYYRGSFVHLDTGRVRHWPRMSSRQLARVFPRGKTIHVPSNGKPLRGYKTAALNLKKGLNADGSRRSTRVRRSLLAGLFQGSGGDEDEDVGKSNSRTRAVARAAPAKPAKPKPAPKKPKPEPVLVAKAEPQPLPKPEPVRKQPSGPDPFTLEASASREAVAQSQDLSPNRLTIPQSRPVIEVAIASAQPAEQEPPVQIALAAEPEVKKVLKPVIEVLPAGTPQPRSVPADDIANLRARIKTALNRSRELSPSERAVEAQAKSQLTAAIARVPVPNAADRATQVALATQKALEESSRNNPLPQRIPVPASAPEREEVAVLQASLQPQTVTDIALDNTIEQEAIEPIGLSGGAIMSPELSLGDLDGGMVKAWAVAASTRVGPIARLTAPDYKHSARRPAPASVYSAGFAHERSPLRADRFTGKALTRVAFAHFGVARN